MAELSAPGRPARRVSWVARVLALIALTAVVVAVIVIVNASMGDDGGASTTPVGESSTKTTKKDGPETPKTYAVAAGDSLTSIADKFGVSVQRLERLNPDVDAQTLNEGIEITLR